MINYSENAAITSLEKKKCKFNYETKLIWIPWDKDAGGCTALGNDSWGRVNYLCHKHGWTWSFKR